MEKEDPDLTKRTAELREDGVEHVITMCRSQALRRPRQVPELTDGKYNKALTSGLDTSFCEDPGQLKKIGAHRGLCHIQGGQLSVVSTQDHWLLGLYPGYVQKK